MFDLWNFGKHLNSIQLLYNGKNGRTYFYVVMGRCP